MQRQASGRSSFKVVRFCLGSLAVSAWLLLCSPPAFAQRNAPVNIPRGLPESVEEYQQRRAELVRIDAVLEFDAKMPLSKAELKVNEKLVALRNALVAKYREQKRFPPSEQFFTIKPEIEQSDLFAFLRGMPKGGVLHIHTSSTAPPSWIIETGMREPNCHVCWPKDEGDAIQGQLSFFPPDKVPAGYQPVEQVLKNDPDFPAKLLNLITISPGDEKLTNLDIWTKFDHIFQRTGGVEAYDPLFEKYYTAAFETLLADNVTYVELRTGMGTLYDLQGTTALFAERVQRLWDVRNRLREKHPEFDLKIICSGHRWVGVPKIWPYLEQAVAARKAWAKENFVVGFDLVGEEDAGHTTDFFLQDWIKLKSYLREQNTTLPLYFHDGESDWPLDDNLYDAYLLGSRRVGHGFNLFRFPDLEQRFIRSNVAVEVCPISNQELRYVEDLRIHPASGYINRGVPCVLGNDDPGILGNPGLSYDFWEAIVAWELDLRDVKQLAFNSLAYSAMTPAQKQTAIDRWHQQWTAWIVEQVK